MAVQPMATNVIHDSTIT